MRIRLTFLLKFYATLVALFAAAKPLFMLFNGAAGRGVAARDYCAVVWHGLPLDLATAAYLTALPWLAVLLSVWVKPPRFSRASYLIYIGAASLALALILVADACLYGFWGFKLDGTVFNYLDSPKGAAASVSATYLMLAVGTILLVAAGCFALLRGLYPCRHAPAPAGVAEARFPAVLPEKPGSTAKKSGSTADFSGSTLEKSTLGADESGRDADDSAPNVKKTAPSVGKRGGTPARRCAATALLLLAGGLLFLAIRGGTGRSTANVGMVYYSDNQFLNHAAVNPAFSLFYSLKKTQDFGRQAEFFPEAERAAIVAGMRYDTLTVDPDTLLRTARPNVLIVIMEGMGGTFVESVGGAPGITPHLDSLAAEGVVFTRCYANSFRTDRGTVCTLSGYPSFPDVSVMKLPAKSRTLPSIAASLARAGYRNDFLYGGDKNFTNMNSYLLGTGYHAVYGDTDFPVADRRTHAWGVTDSITFERLCRMVAAHPRGERWHTAFLTLASHEPWVVPYARIPDDEVANSMAYLDHCIGRFVERIRHTAAWEDLLIVFLPDHGIPWPGGLAEEDPRKWHIPMVWAGGAVKGHRVIDRICNQTDLAATLLGQMGLPHGDFRFSRDVASRTYRYPCAVHTWSGGVALIDTTGHTVYDLTSARAIADKPHPSATRLDRAKAFLQTCYDDLGAR